LILFLRYLYFVLLSDVAMIITNKKQQIMKTHTIHVPIRNVGLLLLEPTHALQSKQLYCSQNVRIKCCWFLNVEIFDTDVNQKEENDLSILTKSSLSVIYISHGKEFNYVHQLNPYLLVKRYQTKCYVLYVLDHWKVHEMLINGGWV
jgi:hypothetical protein